MKENFAPPEITVKAIILGVSLSVILAAANAYLGLFAGMTVSASIPAAVISMGILKFFKESNILENNIVQTAASAGESLAAGVIFTLPALVILNFWEDFDFLWVTTIACFGGILGVLFTIPLRRALIIEDPLMFPEGVATAEVLKSGERGGSDVKYIASAGIIGALFKFGEAGLRIWTATIELSGRFLGSIAYFGSNLSPALVSVGYIVGINIAVLIFLGGALNWLIAIPFYAATHPWPMDQGIPLSAGDWAAQIWSTKTRFLGVGAMVVGGLWALINLRQSILNGIRSGLQVYKSSSLDNAVEVPRTEKDTPMRLVLWLLIISVIPLFIIYEIFIVKFTISIPMAILMLIAGFLFSAVAGYMAGLVGSSNNPISGVTIATVLSSSLLLLLLMGSEAENGPPAAILVGAVVCCAAAIAGDNMQDLKAGHIVGATPWKQQVMQMVGVVSASFVMAPVLTLLLKAYGFAGHSSATENALIAVQANLMASVAFGVFKGGLPWDLTFLGMLIAVVIIIFDKYLEKKGSTFRAPVLAVAVGIYLPFELSVPILIGGLINLAIKKYQQRQSAPSGSRELSDRRGLLFASGLITGEALVGILMAIPIVATGQRDVLAVVSKPLGAWPGIILLIGVGYLLYKTGINPIKKKLTD